MTKSIPSSDFLNNFLVLLDETFEHPPRPAGSAYLDRGVSWRSTLQGLSAEQASRPITTGATSVAGQLAHALYYLEVTEQFIHGEKPKLDWPGSWTPRAVEEDAWDDLRSRFFAAYDRLRAHWRAVGEWDEDALGDALVVLIHSAYHLGAVRQIARVVARDRPSSEAEPHVAPDSGA